MYSAHYSGFRNHYLVPVACAHIRAVLQFRGLDYRGPLCIYTTSKERLGSKTTQISSMNLPFLIESQTSIHSFIGYIEYFKKSITTNLIKGQMYRCFANA